MKQEDFDEYIRQVEPSAQQSAVDWQTAIGLQQVDGLKPSQYLLDVAQRNIEGDITIDEVRQLLDSYYRCKVGRTPDADETAECDKAAANIKKILSTNTFAFNTNGFVATHRRIFDGVFKHAGELRTFDITKKEWVLGGDTVNYLNWEDLRRAIDYDLQQERDFSYKGLTEEEKVRHICRFVSGLWQIHPFCEGNTRTTAVFTIQYLRSMLINAPEGWDTADDKLTPTDDKPTIILAYLKEKGQCKTSELSELLGLKPTQTKAYLCKLLQEGKIVSHGANKNRTYSLA